MIGYGESFILECPDCMSDFTYMEAVHNENICTCPKCGMSFWTYRNIPFFMSASDRELLEYRRKVSAALHEFQDRKGLGVSEAYGVLSSAMKIPYGKTNIGYFNLDQCKEALAIIQKLSA